MKRFLKTVILIAIIVALLYGVLYIAQRYFSNLEVIEKSKTVLTQINVNNLDISKEEIQQMVDLGDGDYLLVTKDKLFDENYEPIENAVDNNYYIYKYNIDKGVEQQRINIQKHFEIVNIDTNKKEVYIRTYNQNSDMEKENVIKIKYETMQREDIISIGKEQESLMISKNGNVWTYLKDNSIYISNANFRNPVIAVEEMNNEVYVNLCDVIGDSVVYASYSHMYPEKNGFGIINVNKGSNTFINVNEPNYLGYNDKTNEIYYFEKSTQNKIWAVNIDDLQTKEVINIAIEDNVFISNYYMSKDFKYVSFIQYGEEEGLSIAILKIYNMLTNEIDAIHKFNSIDNITDIYFENDNVFVLQNGKVSKLDIVIEK